MITAGFGAGMQLPASDDKTKKDSEEALFIMAARSRWPMTGEAGI